MSHLLISALYFHSASPHPAALAAAVRVHQLAAAPATVTLDTTGVYNWIVKNALNIAVLVTGVGIAFVGKRAQFAEVLSRVGILVVGLTVVGLSVYSLAVGQSIAGLFVH